MLDAQEARAWLRLARDGAPPDVAWFGRVEPVDCEIRWVEEPNAPPWTGVADRIARFDPETRTVALVVRVSAAQAWGASDDRPPLVAGMFCEVRIPGRAIESVYVLPQRVLTLDRSIRVARDGRLVTVPVEIVRQEGDLAYVRAELAAGDSVITTRLVNPVDNTPVDVQARVDDHE
jgi:hypothetical protein